MSLCEENRTEEENVHDVLLEKKTKNKKTSKSQKKHSKKYHKKVLNFLKEFGGGEEGNDNVAISDEATRHIFVGNGGMLCGLSREDILMLFKTYGHLTELVLLPRKSFCLISYSDVCSAEQAYDQMDGYVFVKHENFENSSCQEDTKPVTSSAIVATTEPVAPFYLKYLRTRSLEFAYKSITCCSEYPTECEPNLVDGLILREDFIDESYEAKLYNYFHDKCNYQQGIVAIHLESNLLSKQA